MLVRVVVVVVVLVVAAGAAVVLRRRRVSDAPTQPSGHHLPAQLDRRDFDRPDAAWLVAVFSSASCHTCADVVRKAAVLTSREVAVVDVEYTAARTLHDKYGIDGVPCVCIADRLGVVRRGFLGPVSATDLWAAVAECREPGTSPEPDLGRPATPGSEVGHA